MANDEDFHQLMTVETPVTANNNAAAGETSNSGDEPHVAEIQSNHEPQQQPITIHGNDNYNDHDIVFVDHFSLRQPSRRVRFRGAIIHVYQDVHEQLLLEDRMVSVDGNGDDDEEDKHNHSKSKNQPPNNYYRHVLTAKRMPSSSFGVRVVRATYTLVALLFCGFLFVFSFQILLFLLLNMAGTTPESIVPVVGVVLSIPLVLYATSGLMAYGTTFVTDTWNGHVLLMRCMVAPTTQESQQSSSSTTTTILYMEWFCFIVFLGIPALTIAITLFLGKDDWWEVSALVWMICVFGFFLFFSLVVMMRETTACLELIQLLDDNHNYNDNNEHRKKWYHFAKRAILLTLRQKFSGCRSERYLVSANNDLDDDPPSGGYATSPAYTPDMIRTSLYSRLTQLPCLLGRIFTKVDPPTRFYSVQEIRSIVPIITEESWSLERSFCWNKQSHFIYSFRKANTTEQRQGRVMSPLIQQSLYCMAVGLMLVMLMVIAFLLWMGKSAAVVIFLIILIVLCCVYPAIRSSWNVYRTYKDLTLHSVSNNANNNNSHRERDDENGLPPGKTDDEGLCIYQVWETLKVTQPKDWYCWTCFGVDVVLLYLWPVVSLFVTGDYKIGTLFLIFGIFAGFRLYFDAGFVLSEAGTLDDKKWDEIANNNDKKTKKSCNANPSTTLQNNENKRERLSVLAKARTSEILGNITRSRTAFRWLIVYGILALMAVMLCVMAAGQSETEPTGGRPAIAVIPDFYYPSQEGLAYPSCVLKKGFSFSDSELGASLVDFAFLAAISYETPNASQYYLDKWFGNGTMIDEAEFVTEYRQTTNTTTHPVFYKLISIRDLPGHGIVSIRGSETTVDWLVNMQLWSSAILTQVVRAILPLGWLWTPILDELIRVVNFLESSKLKEVSYYRLTTQFVNNLLENNYTYEGKSFTNLRVTGASLGGGLAIITGAQTKARTVAISGLNAVLSRYTFTPPLSMEALNTQVFNVIPDRDLIAHIGDQARLFQEIDCRAPMNSLFGCHGMWRTTCEIAYTCGTNGRPVLCRCAEQYGYPEPVQNGTRSFAEACNQEEEAIVSALPYQDFQTFFS